MLCNGFTLPNFNPKKEFLHVCLVQKAPIHNRQIKSFCNVTFYMYMYKILYKKYSKKTLHTLYHRRKMSLP